MSKIHLIYLDINTGYFPGIHHGLAWLAAAARLEGHTLTFHHLSNKEPPDNVVSIALNNNPDVVGFSITTNQRKYLDKYSKAIADQSKVLQICGGVHPTIDPMEVLKLDSIQGVCIGEGERTVPKLLNKLDKSESILNTPGFWWRTREGKIIQNPVPPLDSCLSILPYPDYSFFDVDKIIKYSSGWMPMMVTRGCPHNCSYCCNHALRSIYPNKKNYFRLPPVEYAIGIIKHNLSCYPAVKGINFADDLLVYNGEWFEEFADRYQHEVALPFTCNSRVEYVTEKTAMALKKAGCICVHIGVESGDEWIRKYLLHRRANNAQIIKTFQLLNHFGIKTFSYNIVGFPFETKKQMQETLSLNKLIRPHMGTVFYFFPYPGTRLYYICKEFGLLKESSKKLSSYLERPAIKLTHCKIKDCKKIYYKIRLYLLSRTASYNLRFASSIISPMIYSIFRIYPSFFVNLFTKRSKFKYIIRKIMYGRVLHHGTAKTFNNSKM